MNTEEMKAVIAEVKFHSWSFVVEEGHGGIHLQAFFLAQDADLSTDGTVWMHTSRKWLLSPYMTKSEIVQTAFKCVLTAVEHEAREFFTYKGNPIFGPHFDVDALVDIYQAGKVDKRDEPKHHCGLQGYNPMIDERCPACATRVNS